MASEGLNRVMLIGNLGADPELKSGATSVLRLRLATNEKWMGKDGERQERVEWHTVVFFGKRAEGLSKHLSKGESVYVEGRLQTRSWEDNDGNKRYSTEVVGTQLIFLGGKREGGERRDTPAREERTPDGGAKGGGDFPADDFGDDDIPFAPRDGRLP